MNNGPFLGVQISETPMLGPKEMPFSHGPRKNIHSKIPWLFLLVCSQAAQRVFQLWVLSAP